MRESHPPGWFCRQLPRLLGQLDEMKIRKLRIQLPSAGPLIGFAASCRTQLPDVSTRPGRSRDRVHRRGCLFRLVAIPVCDGSTRHSSSVCLAGSKGSNPTVRLQPTSSALARPWTPWLCRSTQGLSHFQTSSRTRLCVQRGDRTRNRQSLQTVALPLS